MAARPLSVAVYTAHKLIGEALAISLSAQPNLVIAGHTCEWVQLAALCRLRRPEVLVIEMVRDADPAALCGLLRQWPALTVIMVGDSGDAIVQGVHLLVPYQRGLAALLAVLQELYARRANPWPATREGRLTDRELDVLRLVGAGLTVPDIAKLLDIGPRSVENHKRRIFAKLGAHSQALAVSNVATMGLLAGRTHPFGAEIELTPREKELLLLATHGASMRQMASSLGVAPKTVESQLSSLYRKLGVHNRAAAVAVAHAFGLVPEKESSINGNPSP